jgi:hypothetical protein
MSVSRRKRLALPMVFLIVAIAIAAAVSSGCQRMEKFGKHWESGMDGLDRTISLYSREGALMGRWNAKTYIESRRGEGSIAFLDSAGHEVKLVGGIIVVQEN